MDSQAHTRALRPEDAIPGTFSALHFLRKYSLLAPTQGKSILTFSYLIRRFYVKNAYQWF